MQSRQKLHLRTIMNWFAAAAITALSACASSPAATSTSNAAQDASQGAESIQMSQAQFDAPPQMQIDSGAIYVATIRTAKGEIEVELFADRTPITVNNFVFLAEQGFYDGTTFHRVLPGFMAQGGDPTGTGSGGPGYQFVDEIVPGVAFDQAGLLAMANSGPNTNGSQFFITYAPTPWLNGLHTIFGKVIRGMDVLEQITPRDPQESPDFTGDVVLEVSIETRTTSELPAPTPPADPNPPTAAEGRPLADLPPNERENLYNTPPELAIDTDADYKATIETTKGVMVVKLDPEAAPVSVNNFILLAELGYWDGFPISNVQAQSFILTGSPANAPESDIGYTLPSEAGLETNAGAVGFWLRQDLLETSGSQIFFLLDSIPGMESLFTVIGYITEGQDIAGSLTLQDSVERITITGP